MRRRHDLQAGLLERLPDRALDGRLVRLQEAARLRPGAVGRLDGTAQQHQAAVVGDRQRRDHHARIDVRDEPAGGAPQPLAMLAGQAGHAQRGAASGAEAERGPEPGRNAVDEALERLARAVVVQPVRVVDHRRQAVSTTIITAAMTTKDPTRTAAQTIRNRPVPRWTGSQASAERQMRTMASAVTASSRAAADEHRHLDPERRHGRAQLERHDGDDAAEQDADGQVDEDTLEWRRLRLGHPAGDDRASPDVEPDRSLLAIECRTTREGLVVIGHPGSVGRGCRHGACQPLGTGLPSGHVDLRRPRAPAT